MPRGTDHPERSSASESDPRQEHSSSSQSGSDSDTDDTSVSMLSDAKVEDPAMTAKPRAPNSPPIPVRYFHFRGRPVHARFWEGWEHDDIVLMAPAVAEFFCASQLFELAFDVSYRYLCSLRESPQQICDESLIAVVLICVRTASTVEQYFKATAVTRHFVGMSANPNVYPAWLSICLKLYEDDLKAEYGEPQAALHHNLPGLSGILNSPSVQPSQRERFFLAIRAKEQIKSTGGRALLLSQFQLSSQDLYTVVDITSAHNERRDRYHYRGTGQRLLEWCTRVLEEEMAKIGSVLLEFSETCPQDASISQRKAFLSDSFFRFLLRIWPRKPPLSLSIPLGSTKASTPSSNEADAVHFELFEALAAFSPLVIAKVPPAAITELTDLSLNAAAPAVLQTVGRLLENALPFHRIFLEVYWSRISTHVSKVVKTSRDSSYMQTTLEFASSLAARHIHSFVFADHGQDLMPEPTAYPVPRVNSNGRHEQRAPSFNDPIFFQRTSGTSSRSSHLSAFRSRSRASTESTNSKEKRPPSSAAMSVDSWKLNAYFPMSDTSSVRESVRDNDSVMVDIEEEPDWI